MTERHLVSTRRQVPAERRAEYNAAWERLHRSATAQGAHAWRFISAKRDDLFLEFLEFAAGADPRDRSETMAALDHLGTSFGTPPPPADPAEEWREVSEMASPETG